jgi:phosphohistidine phosphatase
MTTKSDFKRKLIKQGKNDSLQVAERLKKQKIKPDLVITSPAPRAAETARIFAKQLKYKQKNIKSRKSLFRQTEHALLDVVHEIDDRYDTVMIVGHDPSITDFVHFLIQDFKEIIPTCGVVGIEFDTLSWRDISQGQGVLKLFDFPQPEEKKETTKSRMKNLQKELAEKMVSVLKELNITSSEKTDELIQKTCKKIAKESVKLGNKQAET